MKLSLPLLGWLLVFPIFAAEAPPLPDLPLLEISGQKTSLRAFAGKVLLIVNVASKCGQTPQYAGLESLQREFGPRGFTVLGFPCNEFGGQEPGSAADIQQFCRENYRISFPLFAKTHVKPGPGQHPLFVALTGPAAPQPGEVGWNFEKFLVGRDGRPVRRFDSSTEPDDGELLKAIEKALAKK